MIKRIAYTHVKNRSGDHELAPITAVVGPNFSGKTAVADALRIGLLGHHPALGTTGAATMQLTTEDAMSVALHTERGVVNRTWTRKGKSVKTASAGEVAWEPSWLDASAFINATAKERIRLVVGGKAGGADNAIERLGLTGKAATFDDLEACAKEKDDEAKELRTEIKRWEGLLQGSAELEAETAMLPPAPNMDDLRNATISSYGRHTEAKEKVERLAAAVREFGAYREQGEQYGSYLTNTEERLVSVQEQIAAAALKDAERIKRLNALQAEAAELWGFIKASTRLSPETVDAHRIEIEEATSLPNYDTAPLSIAAQQAQDTSTKARGRLHGALIRSQEADKAWAAFESLECCPTCKASEPGWKAAVQGSLMREAEIAREEYEKRKDEAEQASAAAEAAVHAYEHAQATMRRKREIPALQAALERNAALKEKLEAHTKLAGQIEEASDDHWETEIASLREEEAKLTAALQWQVRQPRRVDSDEYEAAENALESARAAVEAAQDAEQEGRKIMEARQQITARKEQAAEARKRLDEATEKLEEATARAKEIRKVVKEEIDALWGKITTIANRLTAEFEQAPISMNAAGEAGYWNGPSWVPFEAMSGSEQLLASTAISIGLQADNDERIVIVDELSRMSHQSKDRFVDALGKLIFNNELDQAILIDHDEKYWLETTAAVKVIRTTE